MASNPVGIGLQNSILYIFQYVPNMFSHDSGSVEIAYVENSNCLFDQTFITFAAGAGVALGLK